LSKQSAIKKANEIVNVRAGDRDKTHGGFNDSMERMAKIATVLIGKDITTEDAFKLMLALKLSRLHAHSNFDTLVDIIGYTEGLNNYINKTK
jgi:hypothetical protein